MHDAEGEFVMFDKKRKKEKKNDEMNIKNIYIVSFKYCTFVRDRCNSKPRKLVVQVSYFVNRCVFDQLYGVIVF